MSHPTRPQIINALNHCLTTFANSLAAYLAETDPFLTDNDKDAMGAIAEIAASDKRFELALTGMIAELEGIPQIGSVDSELSEMNYLSFPHLLDVMIRHKKGEVARYAPLAGLVPNYPDVKRLFADILKAHQDHLTKLEGIRKARYKGDEPAAVGAETAPTSPETPGETETPGD
jgi:hypothetical protein